MRRLWPSHPLSAEVLGPIAWCWRNLNATQSDALIANPSQRSGGQMGIDYRIALYHRWEILSKQARANRSEWEAGAARRGAVKRIGCMPRLCALRGAEMEIWNLPSLRNTRAALVLVQSIGGSGRDSS